MFIRIDLDTYNKKLLDGKKNNISDYFGKSLTRIIGSEPKTTH